MHSYNSYSYAADDYSSGVDCTLSLGTPSTRRPEPHRSSTSSSRLSNFCWDFLHTDSSKRPTADPSPSRRCANCDTSSTPLWRNGPRGPKSLCNACGIRYKKEERRATAAASAHGAGMMESHVSTNGGYNYWGSQSHHHDVVSGDSESGSMQFLSWPASHLVYDFTH